MKSPLQMAREQCANFVKLEHPKTDGCLGELHGRCKLANPGVRCGYLEKAVLPLATRKEPYVNGRYKDVLCQYWGRVAKKDDVGLGALDVDLGENVRTCECGAPMGPRKQYCDDCAAKRRKERHRRYNRKRTLQTVEATTNNGFGGVAAQ